MANEVKLTFAGDVGNLPSAASQVGDSMRGVGDSVDGASRSMTEAGAGFDKAQAGFDTLDSRAVGFSDTIGGATDSVAGFSAILKGDLTADALTQAGMGIADLASGFASFLIPQLKQAVTWLGNTKVGQMAVTAATWLWNAALAMNPITIIIIAIIALIAIFVLLWNKCDWFRNFWIGLWKMIQSAAKAVADWFKGPFLQFFKDAFDWVGNRVDLTLAYFKAIPGKLKSMFMGLVDIITWPFRTAFNMVANLWNNTIGRFSWTVPGWVPVIGGNTISAPKIPTFHRGGTVPGMPGQEVLALLEGGEKILTREQAASGGGTTYNYFYVTIPAEDLEEIRTIQDLFDRLRNDSRRGPDEVLV